MSATDELALRQYHKSTWELLGSKLRIVSSLAATGSDSSVHVWFISGCRSYLEVSKGGESLLSSGWNDVVDGNRQTL